MPTGNETCEISQSFVDDLTVRDEFYQHYPHIDIAPDLLALVGIQAENSVAEDKALIREQIFRRLAEC